MWFYIGIYAFAYSLVACKPYFPSLTLGMNFLMLRQI